MNSSIRSIFLTIALVALTACGDGVDRDSNSIKQEQSIKLETKKTIDKIIEYIDTKDKTRSPTIEDYKKVGITGIDSAEKLKKINNIISKLKKEDVDTKEEIQKIADSLDIVIPNQNQNPIANAGEDKNITIAKIRAYADDNNNPIPTVKDYDNVGVTSVNTENIADINIVVGSKLGTDVDTITKIQDLVNITIAYINSILTTSEKIVISDENHSSEIFLQIKNFKHNNVTHGGDKVVFSMSKNYVNIGQVIDHKDGTYSTIIKSNITGDVKISVSINGITLSKSIFIKFIPKDIPYIGLSKNIYKMGEAIVINYYIPENDSKYWVRLFDNDENDNHTYNRRWSYLKNNHKQGQIILESAEEIGKYDIRLFKKGSYTDISRSNSFEVVHLIKFPFSPKNGFLRITSWNLYYFNKDSKTIKKRTVIHLDKIAKMLVNSKSSIIAIQEVSTNFSMEDLTNRMNNIGGNWASFNPNNIYQGFIYNSDKVEFVSGKTLLDEKVSIDEDNLMIKYPQFNYTSYIPLEATFKSIEANNYITLLNVHPFYAYKEERKKEVKWISSYIYKVLKSNANKKILVLGDFNNAPWGETSQQINYKDGLSYINRRNGNASYYDHIYASSNILQGIDQNSSFVILPSQYGMTKEEFFYQKIDNELYQTYSDHYPVFVDLLF